MTLSPLSLLRFLLFNERLTSVTVPVAAAPRLEGPGPKQTDRPRPQPRAGPGAARGAPLPAAPARMPRVPVRHVWRGPSRGGAVAALPLLLGPPATRGRGVAGGGGAAGGVPGRRTGGTRGRGGPAARPTGHQGHAGDGRARAPGGWAGRRAGGSPRGLGPSPSRRRAEGRGEQKHTFHSRPPLGWSRARVSARRGRVERGPRAPPRVAGLTSRRRAPPRSRRGPRRRAGRSVRPRPAESEGRRGAQA